MEKSMGLLRIKVKRGTNLPIRDTHKRSSDPFVVVSMGQQTLKTHAEKENCNPEWNVDLTLCITDPNLPVILTVYDKDTLTGHDKMGEAEIDFRPYVECYEKMQDHPHETPLSENEILCSVKPSEENCLAEESCIMWKKGKITQDMFLRLRDAECGEVEIQLEFIKIPDSHGQ